MSRAALGPRGDAADERFAEERILRSVVDALLRLMLGQRRAGEAADEIGRVEEFAKRIGQLGMRVDQALRRGASPRSMRSK